MPTAYNRATNSATNSITFVRGRSSISQVRISCLYDNTTPTFTLDPAGSPDSHGFLLDGVRPGSEIIGPDIPTGAVVTIITNAQTLTSSLTPTADHGFGAYVIFDQIKETVILDWVSASFTQNAGTAAKDIAITISARSNSGTIWDDFIIGGKVLSSAVSKKDGIFLRFPIGLPAGLFAITADTKITATMDQASAGSFDLAVGYHDI